jgi:hypothetical protein
MLYNDTALNKIINVKWKGKWQEETVFRFKQGPGAAIEGNVKDKFRISILTDSTSGKTIQQYTVLNLAFPRAYKRSFDNSGVEVEPWKSATKKVNTGYLMSSYKTVELETSAITLQDLLVLINVPEFDGRLPKLEPDTVRVFCNESSLGNIEVNVGESVRLKTKGNGPYIEYVARLDDGIGICRLALFSIQQTDRCHFRKIEEVLNGYVTNPTPTLTATLTLTLIEQKKRL